jgi:hypothetical protein
MGKLDYNFFFRTNLFRIFYPLTAPVGNAEHNNNKQKQTNPDYFF